MRTVTCLDDRQLLNWRKSISWRFITDHGVGCGRFFVSYFDERMMFKVYGLVDRFTTLPFSSTLHLTMLVPNGRSPNFPRQREAREVSAALASSHWAKLL